MERDRQKHIGLSNSLQNLLFPPGKYTLTQLINLTPFFHGTLTLEKYKSLMLKTFEMQDEERLWWVIKAEYGKVDAKVLLVVLMFQLVGRERRQLGGYNEASRNISANPNASHMNSPRNRNNRALYISNEQMLNLKFITEHLVSFLKLLPNQVPNNDDPFVTAEQLQPLSILFKVDRNKPFASYLPIFNNNIQKLKASTISDHLVPRLIISEQQLLSLQASSFSVIIKDQIQCRGKDLKIMGCGDSEIYIDSSVRSLYVVGCNNCNIYVAACERVAFIDKCQKISLTITTNFLRICNTMDSSLYYYGTAPIILTGDNRSLLVGPNNSNSPDLKGHMKAANIPIKNQYYTQFEQVLCKAQTSSSQKMKPQDYDLLVLPLKQDEQDTKTKPQTQTQNQNQNQNQNQSLLAPQQYIQQLKERNNYYNQFKQKISKSNFSPDMVDQLHSAYQGQFKDWLISKGYNKNLIDLVKMIDKR